MRPPKGFMNQSKNLDWVQLLRGVAALLVVLTHARYALLNTPGYPFADQILFPGAMGVDLFFLISGFIMCYSTANNDGSPAEVARFLIKRFARVWPVYAVITLLSVFVLQSGMAYFHSPDGRYTLWHTLGMLPANPRTPPYFSLTLPLGWTLEFEMYFYMVFAVSLLFRRLRWFALASWVLLTVILHPLGRTGIDMNVSRDLGYHFGYMSIVASPFVLEFLAGAAIGWVYLQPWARVRSPQVAWHMAGVGTALAAWAIYGGIVATHGPTGFGAPLALMVLAMALASKTVHLRVPRLCMWLGSISYSLYLTHLLTQVLLRDALEARGVGALAHTWSYIFLSTALALPVAALSHHYLELGLAARCRDWLLKLVPGKPAAASAQALAALSSDRLARRA
jgi:exopolysaccharide production protein ExoZ